MEHGLTWIGKLVNQLLGSLTVAMLEPLGIHFHDPAHPIPDHIATQLFLVVLIVAFFLWFRRKLSADNPGNLQLCFEQLLTNSYRVGIYDLLDEIVGHNGRRFLAFIGTVGLYVLFCNAISLIPGFNSPTANHTVPLGCALAVFVYYNIAGFREHGALGYGRTFLGPVMAMSPLMLIVEIFSHTARLLSLTVRLWVNMLVSEMLYVIFLGLTVLLSTAVWHMNAFAGALVALVPVIAPALFIVLHAFVAFVQAFVFTLLPVVYVGGAVSHEH